MRVAVSDTPSKMLHRQADLVREASVARRFESARSLTMTVTALSRRALRRRYPGASKAEIDRAFAELHYGTDLVERLLGAM